MLITVHELQSCDMHKMKYQVTISSNAYLLLDGNSYKNFSNPHFWGDFQLLFYCVCLFTYASTSGIVIDDGT